MKTVLLAVAWILALNLLAAVVLALAELHARRKIRREIDALEELWHLEPRAGHTPTRGARLAGRSLVAAVATLVLSGVALANPAIPEAVVGTVTDVVEELTDGTGSGERAGSAPSGGDAHVATTTPPERVSSYASGDPERVVQHRQDASSPSAGRSADDAAPGSDAGAAEESPASAAPPPAASDVPAPSPSPVPTEAPVPAVVPFTANANPSSPTSIGLTWNAVPTATGFAVDVSTDGLAWSLIGQVGSDVLSFEATGLEPGTNYQFRVRATLPSGTEQMADTAATTMPSPIAGPLEVPSIPGAAPAA